MLINYRKILELSFQGITQRTISSSTGHSRDKIREVVTEARARGITELTEDMTSRWLEDYLFPERTADQQGYYEPDWDSIHKELLKKQITLKLLHREYKAEAILHSKIAYAYRTFCEKYGHYGKKYKLTMPIHRKPGEILEVDWAGSTLRVQDTETGESITVYLFVATFPFSQYSYVEAFYDMKTAQWLTAHIHAFDDFQGVPDTVVSDNLKTGVTITDYSEPLLNEAYRQLSDYYRFTIVPARVRSPKDKPSVEGNVGLISRQVIAALRHQTFLSLEELNQAISSKMNEINRESFQKRPGSRFIVFTEEEQPFLHPLRQPRFKRSHWRIAKVQLNYHIQVERMYYSVPYEYVRSEVEVRLTDDLLEVYFKEHRIASHKRLQGDIGQYSTNIDHMPDNHRRYLNHTPEENLRWAETIGPYTKQYVEYLLSSHVEKKALRLLATLRNTATKYPEDMLESGCQTLLSVAKEPTNKLLKTILLRAQKRANLAASKGIASIVAHQTDQQHGFVRGAKYFGGTQHEK